MLTAIEAHLRTDEDVGRGFLVIRGRPLTAEGLLAAAGRTLDEFSWNEAPLAAVSAEVTGPDRTVKDVLAGPRLRTRRTYASAPVLDLIAGGSPAASCTSTWSVSRIRSSTSCVTPTCCRRRAAPRPTTSRWSVIQRWVSTTLLRTWPLELLGPAVVGRTGLGIGCGETIQHPCVTIIKIADAADLAGSALRAPEPIGISSGAVWQRPA
jgi:hypothetical protein